MLRYISITLLFTFAAIGSFAQTATDSAPINWQRYAVSPNEVSVLLPKLPIALVWDDVCSQIESKSYYAYADEVVYSLNVTAKTNEKPPSFCREKRTFNKIDFTRRLSEIRNVSKEFEESKIILENREVTKISFKNSTIWLFDDFDNKRWFELSVSHRENAEFDKKMFFDSMKIGRNPSGIEIGAGAIQTLGDEKNDNENSNQIGGSNESAAEQKMTSLNIIVKPRARYTDAARRNNVQGTIILRVVFLSNGGIGSVGVSPNSEALPHGLTEQAIAAAKKLMFLPQKSGNQTQTVVKSVQYSFSIY